jgi:hypothetical protein
MTFDESFKKALQALPAKEKDKLILKLLKKDLNVANQLYFELVNTDTVEDKRNEVQTYIQKRMASVSERFFSMGHLLMDVRDASGVINEHVNITKDKYGEIDLNCYLLYQVLLLNKLRFGTQSYQSSYTMCIYIIARIYKILTLIKKQHEDLHLEFKDSVVQLGNMLSDIPYLMKTAIYNGLDVNWLIGFKIPDDLEAHVKDLRANGFLK